MTVPRIEGLNHLGLVVEDIAVARRWFQEGLGLTLVEDRGELLFFHAGRDVLAVKTAKMAIAKPEHGLESQVSHKARDGWQSLDHYGFYAPEATDVDGFAAHIQKHGAKILKGPYDRSDGRSVYFQDPCGNVGEYLFYRPKSKT